MLFMLLWKAWLRGRIGGILHVVVKGVLLLILVHIIARDV